MRADGAGGATVACEHRVKSVRGLPLARGAAAAAGAASPPRSAGYRCSFLASTRAVRVDRAAAGPPWRRGDASHVEGAARV